MTPRKSGHSDTASLAEESEAEKLRVSFRDNYIDVQYHFVQFLTEHLVDCLHAFGGDFDQVIILAVLGQTHLAAFRSANADPDKAAMAVWINATRIADVTGLPRQTVRRKLLALAGRGWVRQNEQRGWALVGSFSDSPVKRDLADLNQRGLTRLAKLVLAVNPPCA